MTIKFISLDIIKVLWNAISGSKQKKPWTSIPNSSQYTHPGKCVMMCGEKPFGAFGIRNIGGMHQHAQ
jgi:hypothetical protein